MQTTPYTVDPDAGFRGLKGDPNADSFIIDLANGAAAAQGFGILVKRDAVNPEDQFDIFSGAGEKPAGVLVFQQAQEDPSLAAPLGVALLETVGVMRKGRIWVPIEENVTVDDDVYFRHSTGSGTEIGAFRTDADGVAEVSTLTPTVVNDTTYVVRVVIAGVTYSFTVVSDGTATATEICDAFRAQMAADLVFTALVVATGTTTLILTGQNAGQALDVTNPSTGVMAIVETTPPAPTAELLAGAKWVKGGASGEVAMLEINLP